MVDKITVEIGFNAEGGLAVWVRPTSESGGTTPARCGECKRALEGDHALYPLLRDARGKDVDVTVRHADGSTTKLTF